MTKKEALEKLVFYEEQIGLVHNRSVRDYYCRMFNRLLKNLERYSVKYDYDSPQDLIELMVTEFDYPKDYATNPTRNRDSYVMPRQITMRLCKYIFPKYTLKQIGSYFSGGDHANVLHAIQVVDNMYETDANYRKKFREIEKYFLRQETIYKLKED